MQATHRKIEFVNPAPAVSLTREFDRASRVLSFGLILALLNWYDLEMTLSAFQAGVLYEANPIAEWLLSAHGAIGLRVFKAAMVSVAMVGFLAGRRHWMAELGCLVSIVIYTVVAFAWVFYPLDFS
ncbi:hypothetical protein Mal15_29920 [Stieleria maiorica]|uniref:DUF5658 domain-containing protein n=1 Tax=Stieleria maiorica TaxID=2795974 RepID=A0A5B9MH32_9BACT|nr:DUF5658 family protein [Stieleria maiorica]QEF98934.1 hypothetical protein Mal15_29920 [Stieleria maiorica]